MRGQWLDSLSHCSEVKVLGEGSFGKVGKFNIKDNYPSVIPILSPQNLKFAAFPRRVLREVSLLTVLILFLASIIRKSDFSENYNCICGRVLYKAPQMWIMAIQYYYLLYGGECFTGN